MANEKGEWLRGDILGLLCAQSLGIEALAVPVSCNSAIEQNDIFKEVMRTRIGSPYVIEGMNWLHRQHSSVAGFEANGGFLLNSDISVGSKTLRSLPTRDALLPMIQVLAESVSSSKLISELTQELPARYTASDRLKNFPTEKSKRLIEKWESNLSSLLGDLCLSGEIADSNTIDGLRVTLKSGDIVHLRPSGNSPELRCYVESDSESKAQALTIHCLKHLQQFC